MVEGFPGAYFLKGILVGLAIAAPVGPTALILVRRTLARGWPAGLATGLGAGFADAIYGLVAVAGLSLVGDFLVAEREWLAFVGGVILVTLAVISWRSHIADRVDEKSMTMVGLAGHFFSIFMLTLANPMTVLSFAAVIVAIGALPEEGDSLVAASASDYRFVVPLVLGVLIGSVGWWFFLVALSLGMRRRLSRQWLHSFNRVCAVGLLLFGGYVLLEAVRWAVE
ncbi:MAG TPA: LysE family transporter [Hypericibacter adhaerens]|jgi:threonine/homoserine/homoserine lactone efflux protein|uniref:LysE family translocator n=1 Tax=Hypericibacter adhaerens TaxID=2602016 RepID=UPI002C1B96ED|nr:LysE family transporter [Hypericibacter adhaerens]HWA45488.1 LysE family transporter [Hypericibacter adhaerens]